MGYPETRNASPQAWRRVRGAIGPGEAEGLAKDIMNIITAEAGIGGNREIVKAIRFALDGFVWDNKKQA